VALDKCAIKLMTAIRSPNHIRL